MTAYTINATNITGTNGYFTNLTYQGTGASFATLSANIFSGGTGYFTGTGTFNSGVNIVPNQIINGTNKLNFPQTGGYLQLQKFPETNTLFARNLVFSNINIPCSNNNGMAFSKNLGIVSTASYSQSMYSHDGNLWTLSPSFTGQGNYWNGIVFSNELQKFCAIQNGTGLTALSSDGVNWTFYVNGGNCLSTGSTGGWTSSSLLWIAELAKFSVISSSGGLWSALSSDGISWTIGSNFQSTFGGASHTYIQTGYSPDFSKIHDSYEWNRSDWI